MHSTEYNIVVLCATYTYMHVSMPVGRKASIMSRQRLQRWMSTVEVV